MVRTGTRVPRCWSRSSRAAPVVPASPSNHAFGPVLTAASGSGTVRGRGFAGFGCADVRTAPSRRATRSPLEERRQRHLARRRRRRPLRHLDQRSPGARISAGGRTGASSPWRAATADEFTVSGVRGSAIRRWCGVAGLSVTLADEAVLASRLHQPERRWEDVHEQALRAGRTRGDGEAAQHEGRPRPFGWISDGRADGEGHHQRASRAAAASSSSRPLSIERSMRPCSTTL